MNSRLLKSRLLVALAAAASIGGVARAGTLLKDGDVVGIVGDSITEQKIYSAFIEDYLLMCQPTKVSAMQFGWGGETVPGLNARIKDVLTMKPTIVTTCYGMNDGHYTKINDDIRKLYRDNTVAMVKTFTDAGIRVVLGTPGAVDTSTYRGRSTTADVYNENLAALGQEDKTIAAASNLGFADVHSAMIDAMTAIKAKYGPDFQVAGGDGVHPGGDGHVIMAYAFLKALGVDGNIGTYDVDLAAHTATVSAGHKVLKFEGSDLTLESTQYPFCFYGKPGDPNATATVPEFLSFNQDLNRLTLKVTGPAASYKITWGKMSETFTADQLKAGINLAAEFLNNPFSAAFARVANGVQQKQNTETPLIKGLLHDLGSVPAMFPGQQSVPPAVDTLIAAIREREAELNQQVRASIKPVTHTITIEAVQ